MADSLSPEKRSWNMSRIKGKDTSIEIQVRKYLFSQGFRYRKNVKTLPGTPDIVLPKYRTVVFVNGCFWHKHEGCRYFVWPKNNAEFWKEKINKNVARDQRDYELLRKDGWHVIVVWECELKKHSADQTLARLDEILKKSLGGQENEETNKT